jgi:hypothetical protein
LFGDVVRRWRENIRFTLDQVYFDEGIALRVHERMAELSRYIDAHSHSGDHQENPISISLIAKELALYETIGSEYSVARKLWQKHKPKATFT